MKRRKELIHNLEFRFNRSELIKNFKLFYFDFNKISYRENLYYKREDIKKFLNFVMEQSRIVEVDFLTRLNGFFYALYLYHDEIEPNYEFYEIYLKDGMRLSIPFLVKKLYLSPLYYMDIACVNKKELNKILKESPEFINDYFKSEIKRISCFNKRRINVPHSSFLVGYLYGKSYIEDKIDIKDVFEELRKDYKEIYQKYETFKLYPLIEVE